MSNGEQEAAHETAQRVIGELAALHDVVRKLREHVNARQGAHIAAASEMPAESEAMFGRYCLASECLGIKVRIGSIMREHGIAP